MLATGNIPDIDMPPLAPLADVGVVEAHDQEGGEEEEPAIDECVDIEDEDSNGLTPLSHAMSIKLESMRQAPRPDKTFGSPFALQ